MGRVIFPRDLGLSGFIVRVAMARLPPMGRPTWLSFGWVLRGMATSMF